MDSMVVVACGMVVDGNSEVDSLVISVVKGTVVSVGLNVVVC